MTEERHSKSKISGFATGVVLGGVVLYFLKHASDSVKDRDQRSVSNKNSSDHLISNSTSTPNNGRQTVSHGGQAIGQGTEDRTSNTVGSSGSNSRNNAEISDVARTHSIWWGIGFAVAVPVLLAFLLGLAYRLLRPDGDFFQFSASVAQLVALLSLVGLQMKSLRDAVGKIHPQTTILAWLAVLVLSLVLLIAPQQLSQQLNIRGSDALQKGRLSTALHSFQNAANLDPRNAQAHYNLGNAYQQLQAFDEAIAEYHRAITLDDELAVTYNNLGQLYLTTGRNADHAAILLLTGLTHSESDVERAVLTKNLGWAYMEKGLTSAALSELTKAKEILRELERAGATVFVPLAETSRLMALSYEAKEKVKEAEEQWMDLKGYAHAIAESVVCDEAAAKASTDCVQAELWLAEANDRLAALSERE